MEGDDSRNRHDCDRCPYFTYMTSHLTRHKKCHGNMSNRYVCPHPPCNFRAGNRTNLNNHAKLHTDGKATPTSVSSSGTKTAKTGGPQKFKLVVKLFAREKPKAKMKAKDSSNKTTPTHTYRNSKGQFVVKDPQKTTSNATLYSTSKSKYKCAHCSFQTDHSYSYTRHSAVHDTKRPTFPCPTCSKTFSRSDAVSKHLKRSCPGYPPTLAHEDDVAGDEDAGEEYDEDAEAKDAQVEDAKDEVPGEEDAEDEDAEDKDAEVEDAQDEATGDEDAELPEHDPEMPTTDETDSEQQKENVGQSVTEPTTDLNESNKKYCEFCSYRAKLSCYFRKHMKPCSACGRKP